MFVAALFGAEAVGAGLAALYWRLWGRARFDRQLAVAVAREIARRERGPA